MPIEKKSYFYILRYDQVVLANEFCICNCILFATHNMITITKRYKQHRNKLLARMPKQNYEA